MKFASSAALGAISIRSIVVEPNIVGSHEGDGKTAIDHVRMQIRVALIPFP